MPALKKVDAQLETQIVAMIARGDTHAAIVDWLQREKGIEMARSTVGAIKARNTEALAYMKDQLVQHETTMAATILGKSRKLIDTKLDRAIKLDEELFELRTKFENEEITAEDYYKRVDILLRSQLTVQELNALSKESFNQSQLEANRPTSITDNPEQAKANLEVLLRAIAANDQEAMLKAIFPSA